MIRLLKNIVLFVAGLFTGRRTASAPPPRVVTKRPGWKLFLKRLALLVPVLALVGFLVVVSGIVPIKASSGHLAITAWFLEFSMSRSVATHSIGISPPVDLDDEALVVMGAGHFETGCRPCHGSVSGEQPRIPAEMTPHPPNLVSEIEKWDAGELFYIVKHGVKFTGMPAWPALERDDEVWAMVAFLQRLPGLDAARYRDLVYGDTLDATVEPGEAESDTTGTVVTELHLNQMPRVADLDVPPLVEESCARCHGRGGEGRAVSAFPRLAGQRGEYLYRSLRAFADGDRPSGMMEPVAAGMTDEEMREIALFFERSTARPGLVEGEDGAAGGRPDTTAAGTAAPAAAPATEDTASAADPLAPDAISIAVVDSATAAAAMGAEPGLEDEATPLERGRRIAHFGIPERKVPSCADCHGPAPSRRNATYPLLGGQFADYIVRQMTLFQERGRGGTAYAHLMHPPTWRITEEHMRDVARYYESLGGSQGESLNRPPGGDAPGAGAPESGAGAD